MTSASRASKLVVFFMLLTVARKNQSNLSSFERA
jgi:hypothetical protein